MTEYPSEFSIDLRALEHTGSWLEDQDILEVNGVAICVTEAFAMASALGPKPRHVVQTLIDACLLKQEAQKLKVKSVELNAMRGWIDNVASQQMAATSMRDHLVQERIDNWWQQNVSEFEKLMFAWVTLDASDVAPLSAHVGALASNPSAAVVSARTEGRAGGFVECELRELSEDFRPLRTTRVGEVTPLFIGGSAIGICLDRTPAKLDEATYGRVEQLVFDDWLSSERRNARVRWLWASGPDSAPTDFSYL